MCAVASRSCQTAVIGDAEWDMASEENVKGTNRSRVQGSKREAREVEHRKRAEVQESRVEPVLLDVTALTSERPRPQGLGDTRGEHRHDCRHPQLHQRGRMGRDHEVGEAAARVSPSIPLTLQPG